jgi:hypothetical protein
VCASSVDWSRSVVDVWYACACEIALTMVGRVRVRVFGLVFANIGEKTHWMTNIDKAISALRAVRCVCVAAVLFRADPAHL